MLPRDFLGKREGLILCGRCCMLGSILGEIVAYRWIPLSLFSSKRKLVPVKALEMIIEGASCTYRIF